MISSSYLKLRLCPVYADMTPPELDPAIHQPPPSHGCRTMAVVLDKGIAAVPGLVGGRQVNNDVSHAICYLLHLLLDVLLCQLEGWREDHVTIT